MIDRPLYVDKIMAYVDTPFVKILTGVRRCGKSTILKMIMERLKTERNIPEDRIISCRFDSMEYEDKGFHKAPSLACAGGAVHHDVLRQAVIGAQRHVLSVLVIIVRIVLQLTEKCPGKL